uniref:D(1)-like dopamine receptor-like n=1 Tax=Saccoglossus kowalevskii TaxID=10224 RepID=A0ABM0LUC4_SACKO|nr:PREDICTED: D(1)-like dopamine receptor-like [Saccoglossus kowalevskii]
MNLTYILTKNVVSVDPNSLVTPDRNYGPLGTVVVSAILVAIIAVTLFMNSLIILAFCTSRHVRKINNYFFFSLALTDILMAVLVMPWMATEQLLGTWMFGKELCLVWLCADYFLSSASVFNMTFICIDRYLNIVHPLSYPASRTPKRIIAMIVAAWVLGLLAELPATLLWEPIGQKSVINYTHTCDVEWVDNVYYNVLSTTLTIFVPFIVMTVLYSRMYCAVERSLRWIRKHSVAGFESSESINQSSQINHHIDDGMPSVYNDSTSSHQNTRKWSLARVSLQKPDSHTKRRGNKKHRVLKDKKTATTLGILLGFFAFSWLPWQVPYLVKIKTESMSNNITQDEWFDYFSKLFNPEITTDESMADFHSLVHEYVNELNFDDLDDINLDCSDLNCHISMAEIRKHLTKLKNNKTPGQDGIPAEFWKHAPQDIYDSLHILFNNVLNRGLFPMEWALGLITPVYKKGSKGEPGNYRSIMLLNTISKLYISILADRLSAWIDNYCKIVEVQSGFRKGRSTMDNVFILSTLIEKYVFHLKSRLYCAVIDYEKAFDRVHHYSLFYKLAKAGITGRLLSLFSMYTHVQAAVKTPIGVTEFFKINVGLQQGSDISPLLFCFYVNDIENALSQGVETVVYSNTLKPMYLLYADDLALFSSSPIGLQRLLDRLADYCYSSRRRLNVNLNKSKIIVFRKGGRLKQVEKWFWKGGEIEVVSRYKLSRCNFL